MGIFANCNYCSGRLNWKHPHRPPPSPIPKLLFQYEFWHVSSNRWGLLLATTTTIQATGESFRWTPCMEWPVQFPCPVVVVAVLFAVLGQSDWVKRRLVEGVGWWWWWWWVDGRPSTSILLFRLVSCSQASIENHRDISCDDDGNCSASGTGQGSKGGDSSPELWIYNAVVCGSVCGTVAPSSWVECGFQVDLAFPKQSKTCKRVIMEIN